MSTRNNKNILGTMKDWKKNSPLVEINSDSTLEQLQEGLIKNGHGLQELLRPAYPDADAVFTKLGEIKFQLENKLFDISDTTHVDLGEKIRFILKRSVCQVSMSLFICFNFLLICIFAQFSCLCLGDIAGSP